MNFDAELDEPPHLDGLVPVERDHRSALRDEQLPSRVPRAGEPYDEDPLAGQLPSDQGSTNCRKSP